MGIVAFFISILSILYLHKEAKKYVNVPLPKGRSLLALLKLPSAIVKKLLALKAATLDFVKCSSCSDDISLIGIHKCSCGFVFEGRYFSPCPHCNETKTYIQCVCGAFVLRPHYFITKQ